MRVKRNQLIEGCVLAKDIKLSSSQPFMRKKTVLNNELIEVLKVFLVDEVEVEDFLNNGKAFVPTRTVEQEEEEEKKGFRYLYNVAVKKYQKLFQEWMSGKPFDHLEVRKIVVPLFEELMKKPSNLLLIHNYSNKENYLYHHAIAVSLLASFIGQKLSLSKPEWIEVGVAGALADAGMALIDKKIITKPGPLSEEEFEEVKKHPVIAYNRLKSTKLVSDQFLLGVLQHHEREDGSGYPLGLKGDKIQLYSQIIAVADVYHAMTSERYYRRKKSPYLVLEELWKQQFGKLRHNVVRTFVTSILNFVIGTSVILSDGQKGEIVFYNEQNPTRPLVKIYETDEIINLANSTHLYIEEVVV